MTDPKGISAPTKKASSNSTQNERAEVTSQVGPWAMVPAWVMSMPITNGEFRIYAAARSFCDRDGKCWPTARSIAERAKPPVTDADRKNDGKRHKSEEGCSVSAVRNAIQKFRSLGMLKTTEKRRPGTNELAHLVYQFTDLDPRQWVVTPIADEGVTPLRYTPHSVQADECLSGVTQEDPSEETTEQVSVTAAASTLTHRGPQEKPKSKSEDLAEAEQLVMDELYDEEQTAAVIEFLSKHRRAANLTAYVQTITDTGGSGGIESLAQTALDWQAALSERRDQVSEFLQGRMPTAKANEVAEAFRDARAVGCSDEALTAAINSVKGAAQGRASAYLAAIGSATKQHERSVRAKRHHKRAEYSRPAA